MLIKAITFNIQHCAVFPTEKIDFDAFAEDVLLSVVMPEVPRHMMAEKYGPHAAGDAAGELFRHMEGYRKILAFLRKNGIDVNDIIGGDEVKKMRT